VDEYNREPTRIKSGSLRAFRPNLPGDATPPTGNNSPREPRATPDPPAAAGEATERTGFRRGVTGGENEGERTRGGGGGKTTRRGGDLITPPWPSGGQWSEEEEEDTAGEDKYR